MPIRIVRLGSARRNDEGLRIGTVRRPPRGVKKQDYAKKDLFDVWFPNLAPSEALLKEYFPIAGEQSEAEKSWRRFTRQYLAEMKTPQARHELQLLAALSKQSNFSLGCYCHDESRCHRSLLRELLIQQGADVVGESEQ